MCEHYVDTRIADVPPPDQIDEDGDVAANGNDQENTVRGDRDNMSVVESHVDGQRRQIDSGTAVITFCHHSGVDSAAEKRPVRPVPARLTAAVV